MTKYEQIGEDGTGVVVTLKPLLEKRDGIKENTSVQLKSADRKV